MSDNRADTGIESRRSDRVDLDTPVAFEVQAAALHGSGVNVSEQGVYFTVDDAVPVKVRIGQGGVEIEAELVRVQGLGGGRYGVAVKFREPQPGVVPPA